MHAARPCARYRLIIGAIGRKRGDTPVAPRILAQTGATMLSACSRRQTLKTLLAAAAAGTATACGSLTGNSARAGGSSNGKKVLRLAVQEQNFATTPLTLGQDLGFMAKEGLEIRTTIGQSTSTMTAGLMGGSFDLQIGGSELVVARQQGASLIAIAGLCNAPIWSVVAKRGISGLADLRNRTIATSGPSTVSTVALTTTLQKAGLGTGSYRMFTAGGTAERFTAVRNGRADATVVTSPVEFQAAEQGLRRLGSLYDTMPHFASGFVVTTKGFASGHDATLVAFCRAWLHTLRWMHDPANEKELVRRVSRILGSPASVIQQAYEYWLTGKRADALFPADGKIDIAALEGAVKAFVDHGTMKKGTSIEGFVDQRFLNRAAGA
ncbi:ABC transporter substrate-binding protein [Streptomyces sp. NPDC001315]|uniref:ABC transporter substrate-binding protein n=1 Tax=Streptomyces sp. NPDC001315 TaxID=3364562 RepID=UPI0036BCC755